jgi:hypothetical protein
VAKHSACDPALQSIAVQEHSPCYDITLLCTNDDHGGSEVSTSHKVAA